MLGLFLSLSQTIQAQSHQNSWFRATVRIPVSQKFNTDLEGQHRRQNDLDSHNPLDKNLFYSFRTWLFYKQNNNIEWGFSPFAYFSSYKTIRTTNDVWASPASEYRWTASINLNSPITDKLTLQDRTMVEYRVFEQPIKPTVRLRNRLLLQFAFNGNQSISAGDEILLHVAGVEPTHLLDHNRLFAQYAHKFKGGFKLELGYIYISRLPKNNTELLFDSNWVCNLTYSFKKK
uniref:DUF2490 domain-containing protein n=1 Tax=Flavobacterium sp. TaxID=239 RepID=UPI004049A89F